MKVENLVKNVKSIVCLKEGKSSLVKGCDPNCVITRKRCSHLVCDVIDDNDSVGTSVVAGRDCTKPLLTCSVPLAKRTQEKNIF